MSAQKTDRFATFIPTLVAAATGATLLALLLCFNWPRPVFDWMRVIVPNGDPLPASIAAFQLVRFVVVNMFPLAITITALRWGLRLLPITRPAAIVATILIAVFAFTFALETVSQIIRASGNLTASDATGDMLDGGQLTLHGWETIARRASTAVLYAGLMIATFAAAQSKLARRPA